MAGDWAANAFAENGPIEAGLSLSASMAGSRLGGVVHWVKAFDDPAKGYGFVAPYGGATDRSDQVHFKAQDAGEHWPDLEKGMEVEFTLEYDDRGGAHARDLEPLGASDGDLGALGEAIAALCRKADGGAILLAKLPGAYRKAYGEPLDVAAYGFEKLGQLLEALPEVDRTKGIRGVVTAARRLPPPPPTPPPKQKKEKSLRRREPYDPAAAAGVRAAREAKARAAEEAAAQAAPAAPEALEALAGEILELVDANGGVLAASLPKVYAAATGKTLYPPALGFAKLRGLLNALPGVACGAGVRAAVTRAGEAYAPKVDREADAAPKPKKPKAPKKSFAEQYGGEATPAAVAADVLAIVDAAPGKFILAANLPRAFYRARGFNLDFHSLGHAKLSLLLQALAPFGVAATPGAGSRVTRGDAEPDLGPAAAADLANPELGADDVCEMDPSAAAFEPDGGPAQ